MLTDAVGAVIELSGVVVNTKLESRYPFEAPSVFRVAAARFVTLWLFIETFPLGAVIASRVTVDW